MERLDLKSLRLELVRQDLTQLKLARVLGVPVTTLSAWVRGVHPPPSDLISRIESALRLPRGSVSVEGA